MIILRTSANVVETTKLGKTFTRSAAVLRNGYAHDVSFIELYGHKRMVTFGIAMGGINALFNALLG